MASALDPDRLEALFTRALDVPPRERREFLDRACGDDPDLRLELESLIAADAECAGFLEPSANDVGPRLIGPYRLHSLIGEGGSSTVYLAERVDRHFRRRVALKVLRTAASPSQARRFKAERQILASLEHPHIARLYDGGTTETGQPYFAMELVDGEPVDAFCDRNRLTVDARLALLVKVCHAVHYAHQNLIVHRDLKPSNILVDSDGEPRLLDFGIAKSLNPEITNLGTAPTAPWDRLLTPHYASPEQIIGRSTTTASDVYSLGVVAFELASGQLPFDRHGLSAADLERRLDEDLPRTPSAAVRALRVENPEAANAVAARRGLQADELVRRLDGDLDTLVAMALRREPEHRYGSAAQLADDLERHRAGQAIEARKPSLRYLGRRFLSRYRTAVALALGAILLLLISAVGFAVLAWKLGRERDRVAHERDRAQLFAELLEETFEVSAPERSRGAEVTAREILDRGAERLRWIHTSQLGTKADLATTLGEIYRRLGVYDDAESLLLQAADMHRESAEADRPRQARIVRALGLLRCDQGVFDACEKQLRQAVALQRAEHGDEHLEVAAALYDLATGLEQAARLGEAAAPAEASLAMRRRLGASRPEQLESQSRLAAIIGQLGRLDESIAQQEDVLEAYRGLYGDEHFMVAQVMNDLAATYANVQRFDDAMALHHRALEIRTRVLGPRHPDVLQSLNNLASVASFRQQPEETERYARRALAVAEEILGEDHPNLSYLHLALASARSKLGDLAEAESHAGRAHEIRRAAFGDAHPLTVRSRLLLGKLALRSGRLREAEGHLLSVHQQLTPESPYFLRDRMVLAESLQELYTAKGASQLADRFAREHREAAEAHRQQRKASVRNADS